MRDVDQWLKGSGERMLFVYGENDPWSAERFEPGGGTRDSHWYWVRQGNHGSNIGLLPPAERDEATAILQGWMGVQPNTALATTTATLSDPGAARRGLR